MKILSAVLAFAVFSFYTCGEPASNTSNQTSKTTGIVYDDSPFVADSNLINEIDSLCFATNKDMFHKPKHNHIDVSQFNQPNLKIGYYDDPENGVTRILISENEHRLLNLKYFYYKNNIPIQMHYRYWDKNRDPQFVEETYMYFDEEGKMFYAGERGTELEEGEIPAKMKSIDLSIPKKSKKELYEFALKYWELAKPLVDQHMAAEAAKNTGQ
ncbi:MAG: hypothetical protein R2825_30990 [Saprospiraceae bacterium]